MEEYEKIELRSDDVQEILGTPPSWLVRWGTTVLFVTIFFLFATAWWIEYPDLIDAQVVVSTIAPPVEVVSRTEGPIHKLFVAENEAVEKGQVLAILQSTADFKAIESLEERVHTWQNYDLDSLKLIEPPANLNLGESQRAYSEFLQNLNDYKFLTSDKLAGSKNRLGSLNAQIDNLKRRILLNEKISSDAKKAWELVSEDYARSKKLYSDGLISLNKLREENSKVAAAERDYESLKTKNIEAEMEITNIRKLIGESSVDDKQGSSNSGVRLRESLNALNSALINWKQQYLLKAPISGLATLNANVFSEQQFVKQGQTVLTIAPPEGRELIARATIPVLGAGKVKPGQRVLIKLDNYPYEEFGAVEGVVKSKSLVPTDDAYAILVDLPNGLHSSRGKELKFEQQLQGKAQIVTESRRFIERFFDKIFARTKTL